MIRARETKTHHGGTEPRRKTGENQLHRGGAETRRIKIKTHRRGAETEPQPKRNHRGHEGTQRKSESKTHRRDAEKAGPPRRINLAWTDEKFARKTRLRGTGNAQGGYRQQSFQEKGTA